MELRAHSAPPAVAPRRPVSIAAREATQTAHFSGNHDALARFPEISALSALMSGFREQAVEFPDFCAGITGDECGGARMSELRDVTDANSQTARPC